MKKLTTTALLSLSLAAPVSLLAGDHDPHPSTTTPRVQQQQLKGMGIGALVGTLLAGPLGTVSGAGIGSIAGWGEGMQTAWRDSERRLGTNQQALKENRRQLERQRQSTEELQQELDRYRALIGQLRLDIHFQTDSAVVEPHYYPRLKQLAKALARLPARGLHLQLTGYADQRGGEDYNHRLATHRVEALTRLLISEGMAPRRISPRIQGEREALSTQAPGLLPFDRRVEIRFVLPEQPGQSRATLPRNGRSAG